MDWRGGQVRFYSKENVEGEENREECGCFLKREGSSLEAKTTRIGRRLSRWGFCNLHVLHFFYTTLLSFLPNSLSIICCLGTIIRDSMTSYWSGIDCKFQTVLFSYVFRFKFDDGLEFKLTFNTWCLEVISSFFFFF